jgi:hypothetical protein
MVESLVVDGRSILTGAVYLIVLESIAVAFSSYFA